MALARAHPHLLSRVIRRRRSLFTLAAMAGLVSLIGANATMAAAGGSSAPQVVRAGEKAIGHSHGTTSSGLLSLHSSAATGVVQTNPAVYLVFWGKQWQQNGDPRGAAGALHDLFSNLYGSNDDWGTILDQYCEGLAVGTTSCVGIGTHVVHPTSSLLVDTWFDNSALAPLKATTSQIANEAVTAAAHFNSLGETPNPNAQYVIASPSGTHPDGFPHGFCGWHSSTSSSFGNIAYTNLPYVPDIPASSCTTLPSPGPLDGYESTETHEYAETVTDPFPSTGWLKGGAEIGDLCVNTDAHLTIPNVGTFDVQGLWSNAVPGCVTSAPGP